jgi:hypothetical protein
MKTLTTICLLFFIVSHAHAEALDGDAATAASDLKEYDVEIIIFEDSHARYIKSETWDQYARSAEQLSAARETNTTNKTDFKSIKPAILRQQYKRINASPEYNVLFYGAWRQPGLDKSKAFAININDLKSSHKNKSGNTLTGTFKLVLARYLHIYNHLNYQRKITATTGNNTSGKQSEVINNNLTPNNGLYPLNSHLRMRSKELHYIDHPLVGMLIQINPVKKAKAKNN